MKITLLLGTAAIMVLLNTFSPTNSISRASDRDRSVDNQSTPEAHFALRPANKKKRQLRRLTVSGVWDTTEGELTINQGNIVSDNTSTDGQHLEQSAGGVDVLGIYDKRGGSIRGNFVEGSNTEVEGYWMQDSSDIQCSNDLYKPSLTSAWVLSAPPTKYWGRLRFSFKRDGSFSGVYGYCDEEPQRSWTGQKK
jgi:hypothetical protein